MEEKKDISTHWGRKIRDQFVTGFITVIPVGATILILVWVFTSIDNILQPAFNHLLGKNIPGIGFAATILLIYIVGVVARNIIGRRIIRYGESILARVPIFRLLYNSIRQILVSFAAPDKTGFMQVVLVEFPRPGMRAIGFVTNEVQDAGGENIISVFVPTAPNPTSGFLQIVREKDIVRTRIPVDEAFKMIVSAGRVTSSDLKNKVPS